VFPYLCPQRSRAHLPLEGPLHLFPVPSRSFPSYPSRLKGPGAIAREVATFYFAVSFLRPVGKRDMDPLQPRCPSRGTSGRALATAACKTFSTTAIFFPKLLRRRPRGVLFSPRHAFRLWGTSPGHPGETVETKVAKICCAPGFPFPENFFFFSFLEIFWPSVRSFNMLVFFTVVLFLYEGDKTAF